MQKKHPPSVKTFGGIFLFKNRIFCHIFVLIMEGFFSSSKKIYKKFISKKVVKRSKKGIRVRGLFKKIRPRFCREYSYTSEKNNRTSKIICIFFIQKPNNFPDFCPLGERYFFQKADIFRFPLLLSERYFSRRVVKRQFFVRYMEGLFLIQKNIYKKFISKKLIKRSKKGIRVRGFLKIIFQKSVIFSPIFVRYMEELFSHSKKYLQKVHI